MSFDSTYTEKELNDMFLVMQTLHGKKHALRLLEEFAKTHELTRDAKTYVEMMHFMADFTKKV